MSLSKKINFSILIIFSIMLLACAESDQIVINIPPGEEEVIDDDNELVAPAPIVEDSNHILFSQDFESFDHSQNWQLTDFGIGENPNKDDFTENKKLNFSIKWTTRTRKVFAKFLNREKSEFSIDDAENFCEPKIEIGKERVYGNSNSENLIAELDTDASRCGITGGNPATVELRSFVPTQIGYKYRVSLDYKMRSYSAQTAKSYKDLVVRFGSNLQKYEPIYDQFQNASLELLALNKFSQIIIKDNGLPDSYGVLVDNIKIELLGKSENYESCANLFKVNSKGFKKCLSGELNTEELCEFDQLEDVFVNYKTGTGVSSPRSLVENLFNPNGIVNGNTNFLSLGLEGKLELSCMIDGHKGLYDVFEKTISFQEVSWGNATPSSYPELARVHARLEGCDDESLNRVVSLGQVATSEEFSFTFGDDVDGLSYAGCKLVKLIIRDITPKGSSSDGVDINSFKIQ